MDYYVLPGLIVFFFTCLFFAIVGGLIYLIYLPLRNYWIRKERLSLHRSRQINIGYALLFYLLAVYSTYDAFFPSESFYAEEFEEVTLRDLPESAVFVAKHASYPDFHGDYCSGSQIRLSKKDYARLLSDLSHDSRIVKSNVRIGSDEFDEALQGKRSDQIIHGFSRNIPGEEDHYLYIGFYDDGQTIFVNICVT